MPDYSKGCIYILRHKDDIDGKNSYVGSTTNFRQRKNLHKSCCNNINSKKYNYSKYKYIRDNDGWENWVMEWIEDYPCNSKRELERREGEIIKQRAKLNFVVAGRTNKEWRDDNKEILAEKRRIYLQNNKQILAERRRIYLQNNHDEIYEKQKEYQKQYQKNYRQKNKDKYNEYQKLYRENTKK